MTPLGKYDAKTVNGKLNVEPTVFVASNWKIFCETVDVVPVPQLTVLAGLGADAITTSDTAAMFVDPDETKDNVYINTNDIQVDCNQFTLSGLNPIGLLWGLPAGMIRAVLFRRKLIEPSQRIGMVIPRRAGWPKALIETYKGIIGHDVNSDFAKRRTDTLIIQAAVQLYMQSLAPDAEVDCTRLKEIIWSKRDDINLEFFRI